MAYPALNIRQPDIGGVMARIAQQKSAQVRNRLYQSDLDLRERRFGLEERKYEESSARKDKLLSLRQAVIEDKEGAAAKFLAAGGDSGFLDAWAKLDEREQEEHKREARDLAKAVIRYASAENPRQKQSAFRMMREIDPNASEDPAYLTGVIQSLKTDKELGDEYDRLVRGEEPPAGFQTTPTGLEPRPGGPADPAYKGRVAEATRDPNAGGPTQAQTRTNTEIDRARQEVTEALGKYNGDATALVKAAFGTDPIIRIMGGRDPLLVSAIKKAMQRKIGDDPDFEQFREQFLPLLPTAAAAEPEVAPGDQSATEGGGVQAWFSELFGGGDAATAGEPVTAPPALGRARGRGRGASQVPLTDEGMVDATALEVGVVYRMPERAGGGLERWNGTEFEPVEE